MVPFPSFLDPILEEKEEEEEDEEEDVPLQRRTQLARPTEQEKRRSSTVTRPSVPEEPLEITTSEDEVQKWVDEQGVEGDDIFEMSDFDFMPIGIDLIGDKIQDTPIN